MRDKPVVKGCFHIYTNLLQSEIFPPMNIISVTCDEGPGLCSLLLTMASLLMILSTLPLSLLFTIKVCLMIGYFVIFSPCQVVQEYERAVIFRLGRLLTGGARGPGVFFIIPCVDIYEKIDMRTKTFEIPPQEVWYNL